MGHLNGIYMKNAFYVYFHRRDSDGSIFYVGKGTGNRAWREHGRSEYWMRVRKKHGLKVDIHKEGMTEKDAHKEEMKMIKEIGRKRLCNHTNGGEGMSGYRHKPKTIALYSIQRLGRKHTKEACKKMSEQRKGVKKSEEHIKNMSKSLAGRKFTEEHRKKLSESVRAINFNPDWGVRSGKARMKKVYCINNSTEYESTKQAAKDLGLCSGSVSRVCNGKYKHTKGFIFRYLKDENTRAKK